MYVLNTLITYINVDLKRGSTSNLVIMKTINLTCNIANLI